MALFAPIPSTHKQAPQYNSSYIRLMFRKIRKRKRERETEREKEQSNMKNDKNHENFALVEKINVVSVLLARLSWKREFLIAPKGMALRRRRGKLFFMLSAFLLLPPLSLSAFFILFFARYKDGLSPSPSASPRS